MEQVIEKNCGQARIEYNSLVLREIIRELSHIENKDGKDLHVHGVNGMEKYSINELISEINNGTEFGLRFYRNAVGLMYETRPNNVGALPLKEISRLVAIEYEAKRLGLDKG